MATAKSGGPAPPGFLLSLYNQVPTNPFGAGIGQTNLLALSFTSATSFVGAQTGTPTPYNSTTATSTNPYAGEKIVRVVIKVVGGYCGLRGSCGTVSSETGVIVYGLLPPSSIAAREILSGGQLGATIPAGQGMCVGRRYQFSAYSAYATTFDWTTNVGTVTATGVTATLDLSQVTAANAPFNVQVGVTARSASVGCINTSSAAMGTFYFRDTNQPQNLRMDGNPQICSTPAVRTIRVDPVAGTGVQYNWRIVSGSGNFNGRSSAQTNASNIDLTFTGPGTVALEVTAQTNCNRISVPLTSSFSSADPNAIPAPLSSGLLQNYYSYSWRFSPSIVGLIPIDNPQNGISYSFSAVSTELFNQKYPSPGGTVSYYPSDPKATAGPGYVRLGANNGSTATSIEILDARVASATIRVVAVNGCGASSQTQTRDYYLVRPFYGSGMQRTTPGTESGPVSAPLLYPNPTSAHLQITAPVQSTHYEYVVVLNAQGTVVQELHTAGGVQELNLSALPAGIYAVRLFDGYKFVTKQVEKR